MAIMGVQHPDRKKVSEIGIDTAHAVVKEFTDVLTTEESLAELKLASQDAKGPQQIVQTMGPVLQRLTAEICEKYSFAGGFEEAMQAIFDAGIREADRKIKENMDALMETIKEEISDPPSQPAGGPTTKTTTAPPTTTTGAHEEL